MTDTRKTLWSDEDGVIAIYEHHAYRTVIGNDTLFMTPGVHYFKTLKPDTKIITAYELLNKKVPFHILTNVLTNPETLASEHISDKIEWTHEHVPFIDMNTQFSAIQIPKYKFAQRLLGRPLCKKDILVSDFNNDLIPWENAGGCGVKYLNGLNSEESFSGYKIYPDWTPEDIEKFILTL